MQLGCEELKLQSLIEYFYAIPGVPAKAMKPDKLNARLQHCKVFIQSTSQGSRCLRKGTKLLYLKEVHHALHENSYNIILTVSGLHVCSLAYFIPTVN